jgi:hypothetical protein
MVITTSAPAAHSPGEAQAVAPSFASALSGPRVRLWTCTWNPASTSRAAIGLPIPPRPMNPTVGTLAVFGVAGAAGGMLPRPRRVTAAPLPAPVILFVLLKRDRSGG